MKLPPRFIAARGLMGMLFVALLGSTPVAAQQATTTIRNTSSYPLETTNSDKVLADNGNVLHLVYINNARVMHVRSADFGASWSLPIQVSAIPAVSPALARDDAGNIGVAFVSPTITAQSGDLYYASWTGSAWSPAVKINEVASEPSMAGYGNQMHLVWVSAFNVEYVSVPTTAPVAEPSYEIVVERSLCGTGAFRLPSIAVANPRPGSTQPIIRVALYSSVDGSCSSEGEAGIQVLERPSSSVGWGAFWSGEEPNASNGGALYRDIVAASAPEVNSLSLSAHRDTGNFHLISSFRPDSGSLWQTTAARGTAGMSHADWQRAPLLGPHVYPVIVDVTSPPYDGATFKYAYSVSSANRVPNNHGPTYVGHGQWPEGASAPTYFRTGGLKSLYCRTPHVIQFEIENPVTFEYRGINLVCAYRNFGTTHDQLRTDPFVYH